MILRLTFFCEALLYWTCCLVHYIEDLFEMMAPLSPGNLSVNLHMHMPQLVSIGFDKLHRVRERKYLRHLRSTAVKAFFAVRLLSFYCNFFVKKKDQKIFPLAVYSFPTEVNNLTATVCNITHSLITVILLFNPLTVIADPVEIFWFRFFSGVFLDQENQICYQKWKKVIGLAARCDKNEECFSALL